MKKRMLALILIFFIVFFSLYQTEFPSKQAGGWIVNLEENRFVTELEVQSNPILVPDPESIERVVVSPVTRITHSDGTKGKRAHLAQARGVSVTFLPLSANYQIATKVIIR